MTTLEDLVNEKIGKEECIDFLKIDSQGAELDILRGGKELLPSHLMLNIWAQSFIDEAGAQMAEKVKEEWGRVPYKIKEDAVEQALLAYKTNFEKRMKQRDRKEEVKPFTVHFRKYG
ncbi:unnamed protein product [Bathycoccus prasinos]